MIEETNLKLSLAMGLMLPRIAGHPLLDFMQGRLATSGPRNHAETVLKFVTFKAQGTVHGLAGVGVGRGEPMCLERVKTHHNGNPGLTKMTLLIEREK